MPRTIFFLFFIAATVSALPSTKNAFATLICDDLTLPAVEVLAQSIRAANHTETFIILVHKAVSLHVKETLSILPGARVLEADPLPYPFDSFGARVHIHKPCRFLKLRLWALTKWRKIVFLDADTLVRHNVAELFDAPPFSAVKDPVGMNYNTGVLVLEPSTTTHALIVGNYMRAPSYNVGDQGALNALLAYEAWTPLSRIYNTFHSASPHAVISAKIVHFSGDAKPWLFWNARGRGRVAFALHMEWCTHAMRTSSAVCHMNGDVDEESMREVTVPKYYEDTTEETMMSVLLATYDRDEWRNLTQFFGELPYVREVFVVWHMRDRPHEHAPHHKVHFIYPETDSLNNRFLADRLTSDCVYICDDDVYPSRVSLEMGFRTWQQNPHRLVGFYPRFWRSAPPQYKVSVSEGYNIVLTKGMYAHRMFLNAYSQLLPKRLTDIVNEYKNCEDILFNMMAVGMTGLPPMAVLADKKIRDVGRYNGISGRQDGTHLHSRDVCVNDFMNAGAFEEAPTSQASLLPTSYKNYVIEGHEEGLLGKK